MAFNWPVFITRTRTALIFVAVMAAGLLTGKWSFLALFTLIHFGCWYEYQQLMGKIFPAYRDISPFHRFGVMFAGWCMMLFATADQWNILGMPLSSLGFWFCLILLFVLPMIELLFTRHLDLRNIWISLGGLLYISLSLSLMIHLRSGVAWMDQPAGQDPFGAGLANYIGFLMPLLIIASIWINDTMAYIVGSLIGRTPLSSISPKKTWEGTIGGIILSVAVMAAAGWYAKAEWRHYLFIALIAAIAGTLGDLFESKLKRMAGVKDSGSFMPGHGGFLDRFDSLLFAIPFVWLYATLFM
jgi:phosphatidate cytidylyltransferase